MKYSLLTLLLLGAISNAQAQVYLKNYLKDDNDKDDEDDDFDVKVNMSSHSDEEQYLSDGPGKAYQAVPYDGVTLFIKGQLRTRGDNTVDEFVAGDKSNMA